MLQPLHRRTVLAGAAALAAPLPTAAQPAQPNTGAQLADHFGVDAVPTKADKP